MVPPSAAYHHPAPNSMASQRQGSLFYGLESVHGQHMAFPPSLLSSLVPLRLRVGTGTMLVGMGKLISQMQTMVCQIFLLLSQP